MDTAKHTARLFRATRPALVLLATSLGVLVAQVDTSVVTLAVKRIGADLGSTVGASGLLNTARMVGATLGGIAELAGAAIALGFVRAG